MSILWFSTQCQDGYQDGSKLSPVILKCHSATVPWRRMCDGVDPPRFEENTPKKDHPIRVESDPKESDSQFESQNLMTFPRVFLVQFPVSYLVAKVAKLPKLASYSWISLHFPSGFWPQTYYIYISPACRGFPSRATRKNRKTALA